MNVTDLYKLAHRAGYPALNTGGSLGIVTRTYKSHLVDDNGLGPSGSSAILGQRAGFPMVNNGTGLGYVGQTTADLTASSDLSVGSTGLNVGVTSDLSNANSNPFIDTSSVTSQTINLPTSDATLPLTTSSTTGLSSLFTGLITSLASAGTTVVNAGATSAALQASNAARIASGLPPLNANGTVMTAAQMAAAGYSQTQINALSSQLASSVNLPLMLGLAAAAVVAFMMMEKKT
jgi:hypothetical protein